MTRDGDEARGESEIDRAWSEIVAHYGERAQVESDAVRPDEAAPVRSVEDDEPRPTVPVDDEDRFQPPPAPPLPRPRTWRRGVAWTGVFVGPVLAVLLTLVDLRLPWLLGWVLFGWAVWSFVYLAVLAPRYPRDPWDDGSRV